MGWAEEAVNGGTRATTRGEDTTNGKKKQKPKGKDEMEEARGFLPL